MKRNSIEYKVYGKYALFTDPITKTGGEKFTYPIPTYQALKAITESIYWKPTIIWIVDECRIMNRIQTESKGIRPINYTGGNDLASYTYLKDVEYHVRAHFIWNENRPELANDRNENKHHEIAKRAIEKGGRRDIYLGTRECQGYVEPCELMEGTGYYDNMDQYFGVMYHGMTYADEAVRENEKGHMTTRLWSAHMENGIIHFPEPEACTIRKVGPKMEMKKFGKDEITPVDEMGVI